jgi:hypothetical protein
MFFLPSDAYAIRYIAQNEFHSVLRHYRSFHRLGILPFPHTPVTQRPVPHCHARITKATGHAIASHTPFFRSLVMASTNRGGR